jgi:hypothetical protein
MVKELVDYVCSKGSVGTSLDDQLVILTSIGGW